MMNNTIKSDIKLKKKIQKFDDNERKNDKIESNTFEEQKKDNSKQVEFDIDALIKRISEAADKMIEEDIDKNERDNTK